MLCPDTSAYGARRRPGRSTAASEKAQQQQAPAGGEAQAQTDASAEGATSPALPPRPKRPEPPGVPVSFELENAARVSLAVYHKGSASQIRVLLAGEPLSAGEHSVIWDGLDAAGRPCKPGEYEWRMLQSPVPGQRAGGLTARYRFSLGTSTGWRPWPGQHGGLSGVTCDAKGIYVTGGMSEGAPQTASAALDGTWRWALPPQEAWSAGVDLAAGGEGGTVYALSSMPPTRVNRIAAIDSATGEIRRSFIPAQVWRTVAVGVEEDNHFPAYSRDVGQGWEAGPPTPAPGAAPRRLAEGVASMVFVRDAPSGPYIARVRMADDPGATGPQPAVRVLVDGREAAVFAASDSPRAETAFDIPVESRKDTLRIEFEFPGTRQSATWRLTRVGLQTHAERIAASGEHLAAATTHGGIIWLNPADGQIVESLRHSGTITDLDVAPDGAVYFISENKLYCATKKQKAPEEIAIEGLVSPRRIAVASGGNTPAGTVRLWIAENGTSQQVRLVDISEGKIVASLGRAGGRKTGRYVPTDFLNISDIASDRNGGFIVTESAAAPRRTAHFAADGAVVREWFGGQPFYTYAAVDPADPTRIWMDSDRGWIMEVQADYAAGTWKPIATYEWPGLPAAYAARNKTARRHSVMRRDLDGDGKAELLLTSTAPTALVLRPDEAAGRLVPVAFFTRLFPDADSGARGAQQWLSVPLSEYPPEVLAAARLNGLSVPAGNDAVTLANTRGEAFRDSRGVAFSDLNGNGYIEATELQFCQSPIGSGQAPGMGGILLMDNNFTIYAQSPAGTESSPVTVYQNQSAGPVQVAAQGHGKGAAAEPLTAQSTPVSATAPENTGGGAEGLALTPAPGNGNGGNAQAGPPAWAMQSAGAQAPVPRGIAMAKSPGGEYYHIAHNGGDGFLVPGVQTRGHGSAWPATLLDSTAVSKLDKSGITLWRSGFHAIGWRDDIARTHYPVHFAGFAHGYIGVCDRAEHPCLLWTEDGLYLGNALANPAEDGLPAQVYAWWRTDLTRPETQNTRGLHQYDMSLGGSLVELPDGKALWVGSGWNNCPVYELTGWRDITRTSGPLRLGRTYAAAAEKGDGLRGDYFAATTLEAIRPDPNAKASAQPKPVLQRLDTRIWFTPAATAQAKTPVPGAATSNALAWPLRPTLAGGFVARWTGTIEPRFSEAYTFATYYTPGARLVVDGIQLLPTTPTPAPPPTGHAAAAAANTKQFSDPLPLHAGRKYTITLEWPVPFPAATEAHLSWQSLSQPLEHVPTSALYAPPGTRAETPEGEEPAPGKSTSRKRRR
ncbi:hypothetical protein DB346_02330 [Verrucomicrobia bacterium LW23]|nr:hypothetical protein DB346_02330 [Verrucomicrobia bacterium LW23]